MAFLSLLAAGAGQAQTTPASAASAGEPARAGSTAAADPVDLQDIRNFSRVYQMVRQAYVE